MVVGISPNLLESILNFYVIYVLFDTVFQKVSEILPPDIIENSSCILVYFISYLTSLVSERGSGTTAANVLNELYK